MAFYSVIRDGNYLGVYRAAGEVFDGGSDAGCAKQSRRGKLMLLSGTDTRYPVKGGGGSLDLTIADGTAVTNLRRTDVMSNCAALTTQVMTSVAVPLYAGTVVTNLTFVSATTAAGTPTNWWFALYSSAATPALLQQTADQTSTAWGANTAKTLALAAPVTITTTGVYYAAVMVKATTVPTLAGVTLHNASVAGAVVTGMKVLAQTSGSALTATAPATIATPTTVANVPLVVVN